MEQSLAVKLKEAAIAKAKLYSEPQRKDYSGQTHSFHDAIPLSGDSAAVIIQLSGGKKSVAYWRWIRSEGIWVGFFPTDGHILGMIEFPRIKYYIEKNNFKFNFNKVKERESDEPKKSGKDPF